MTTNERLTAIQAEFNFKNKDATRNNRRETIKDNCATYNIFLDEAIDAVTQSLNKIGRINAKRDSDVFKKYLLSDVSLKSIGETIGRSRERIRQIAYRWFRRVMHFFRRLNSNTE